MNVISFAFQALLIPVSNRQQSMRAAVFFSTGYRGPILPPQMGERTRRAFTGIWIAALVLLNAALGQPSPHRISAMPGGLWHLTPPGYWYVFVAIPILQFVLLRWYAVLYLVSLFLECVQAESASRSNPS